VNAPDCTPNPEQAEMMRQLDTWYFGTDAPFITVHGLAGTGKTTALKQWVKRNNLWAQPLAPTHKAASLWQAGDGDPWETGRTVASFVYGKPQDPLERAKAKAALTKNVRDRREILTSVLHRSGTEAGQLRFNTLKDRDEKEQRALDNLDVVLLDEALYCSQESAEDLLGLGVRVIAFGDPGQLKPVNTVAGFSEPDITLTQVMRGGEGSPIPLIGAAVRHTQDVGTLTVGLRHYIGDPDEAAMVLGYTNASVLAYNRHKVGDLTRVPEPGDRVVSHSKYGRMYKGDQFIVEKVEDVTPDEVTLTLRKVVNGSPTEERVFAPRAPRLVFENPQLERQLYQGRQSVPALGWGYAITVHMAQGSEWDSVHLLPGWASCDEWRELVYTAVTRARHRFTTGPIIGADAAWQAAALRKLAGA